MLGRCGIHSMRNGLALTTIILAQRFRMICFVAEIMTISLKNILWNSQIVFFQPRMYIYSSLDSQYI